MSAMSPQSHTIMSPQILHGGGGDLGVTYYNSKIMHSDIKLGLYIIYDFGKMIDFRFSHVELTQLVFLGTKSAVIKWILHTSRLT